MDAGGEIRAIGRFHRDVLGSLVVKCAMSIVAKRK